MTDFALFRLMGDSYEYNSVRCMKYLFLLVKSLKPSYSRPVLYIID